MPRRTRRLLLATEASVVVRALAIRGSTDTSGPDAPGLRGEARRVDTPNHGRCHMHPWHGPTDLVTLACMNVPIPSLRLRRKARSVRDERGAVTVLLGAAIVIVAYLVLQETKLSVAAADRARAQTAADAAALGGVVDGEEVAADLARRNGATLLSFVDDGDRVQVRVGFRDAVATARAERSETSPFS